MVLEEGATDGDADAADDLAAAVVDPVMRAISAALSRVKNCLNAASLMSLVAVLLGDAPDLLLVPLMVDERIEHELELSDNEQ